MGHEKWLCVGHDGLHHRAHRIDGSTSCQFCGHATCFRCGACVECSGTSPQYRPTTIAEGLRELGLGDLVDGPK